MKRTDIIKRLIGWAIILVFTGFYCVFAYEENPSLEIYKPITDVSQSGQYVSFDFEIKRHGEYQFAMLFFVGDTGNNRGEVERRKTIFGTAKEKGELIPVSMKLTKDGKIYSDEIIDSAGTVRKHEFFHGDGLSKTMLRNIKIASLPPGHYAVIMTVLKDVPAFNNVSSLLYMVSFTPENLARIEKETQAKKERIDKGWYQMWRLAKWFVQGSFCTLFCPDPIVSYRTIDFSSASQSVIYDFVLSKDGGCQVDMLFAIGNDHDETKRRSDLFGGVNRDGLIIPVSLRLIKDGKIYYDKIILTAGINESHPAYFAEKSIWSFVRRLKVLYLPSGTYSLAITTLQELPDLKKLMVFLSFILLTRKSSFLN